MSASDIFLLICGIIIYFLFFGDLYLDKRNEKRRRREENEKDERSIDDWIDPGDW